MNPLEKLPAFKTWLATHGEEIAEMIEFSQCTLDPSSDQLNAAGAELNQKGAVAGYLLSDCEAYLVEAKSYAMRNMPDDLGPTAQKIFLEDRTRDIRRLRDNLKVLVRSLRSLSIAVCSVRKSQRP